MTIRTSSALLVVLSIFSTAAWSQDASVDDIQQGHRWANLICAYCHVATPDQLIEPILRPPAPSFASIAQRESISAESIRTFVATTHHDDTNPNGMPNPRLLDSQIAQVAAYLMSLRNQPTTQAGTACSAEITRLAAALSKAQANTVIGSAPESTAARLHRQPTPQTVAQAETEAQKKVEATLTVARRLDSEGKDAECIATLKKIAFPMPHVESHQ